MKGYDRLVWVDLEMTGLRPHEDLITDVAVIVTDFALQEKGAYVSTIFYPEAELRRRMGESPWHAAQPDYIEEILSACQNGKSESEVEAEIITLLTSTGALHSQPEDYPSFPGSLEAKGDVYLAGNSIGTDRAFIDARMPRLARCLHYRMLDVSSFKLWHVGNGKEPFKKISNHRALDDIRASIQEFRHYVG